MSDEIRDFGELQIGTHSVCIIIHSKTHTSQIAAPA
jgi:hypothetical protein